MSVHVESPSGRKSVSIFSIAIENQSDVLGSAMHRHFIVVAIAVLVIAVSYFIWATAHSRSVDSSAKTSEPARVLVPVPAPITAVSDVVPAVIANPPTPRRHFEGFLAVFVDPTAGPQRLPPDLSARLTEVVAPEEIAAVEHVLLDVHDDDAVRNEAANLLRRSQDRNLNQLLSTILDRQNETERFRSFVVQHLGLSLAERNVSDSDFIRELLRTALRDRHRAVRREALQALIRVDDSVGVQIATHGLADPNWFSEKDLLIRLIFDLDLKDQIPTIRALIRDPDESVQIAALYVLGQWRDVTSAKAIEDSTHSSTVRVQKAAELAFQRLHESEPPENKPSLVQP